jgi:hypothetical protein
MPEPRGLQQNQPNGSTKTAPVFRSGQVNSQATGQGRRPLSGWFEFLLGVVATAGTGKFKKTKGKTGKRRNWAGSPVWTHFELSRLSTQQSQALFQ